MGSVNFFYIGMNHNLVWTDSQKLERFNAQKDKAKREVKTQEKYISSKQSQPVEEFLQKKQITTVRDSKKTSFNQTIVNSDNSTKCLIGSINFKTNCNDIIESKLDKDVRWKSNNGSKKDC